MKLIHRLISAFLLLIGKDNASFYWYSDHLFKGGLHYLKFDGAIPNKFIFHAGNVATLEHIGHSWFRIKKLHVDGNQWHYDELQTYFESLIKTFKDHY